MPMAMTVSPRMTRLPQGKPYGSFSTDIEREYYDAMNIGMIEIAATGRGR